MTTITPRTLPETALLRVYQDGVAYTDCFSTDLPGSISHQQFVAAFYATWAFRPEQFILKWLLKKPSNDAGAAQLAAGSCEQFAAWEVEKRAKDQLLLRWQNGGECGLLFGCFGRGKYHGAQCADGCKAGADGAAVVSGVMRRNDGLCFASRLMRGGDEAGVHEQRACGSANL